MNFIPESSRFERALAWVPFVLSAALVASAVDLAIRRPLVGVVLVQVALVLLVPTLLSAERGEWSVVAAKASIALAV
jgi:hypothetical protein